MLKSIRKPKTESARNANSTAALQSTFNVDAMSGKKQLAVPNNQLKLSEKELDEEFTRILNGNNPIAAQNISRWSHKEKTFKTLPLSDHMLVHFEFEGNLHYIGGGEGEDAQEGGNNDADLTATFEKKTALAKNPFNYGQRATQTPLQEYRVRSTNTDPPPSRSLSGTVTQWSIYDAYSQDLEAKEKAKAKGSGSKADDAAIESLLGTHINEDYRASTEVKGVVSILERMCNQNTFDEVMMDFKYWEDAADEFRDGNGVLLPLWKFNFHREHKKQVTFVSWHPSQPDFFAASFGSYDFGKQGPGVIACFSLKNPSYPEFILRAPTGFMCCEFHPEKPSWIVAGLHDGSVAIFDLKLNQNFPLYRSTQKNGQHRDPVWEVHWQPNDLEDNLNFVSVSTDGRVVQWTVLKNELVGNDIIVLNRSKSDKAAEAVDGKDTLVSISGGTCFDVNKSNPDIFIVGTEDGRLLKCSKAYNSQYIMTYESHQLGVYAVKYNKFTPNIFISASADWTVKVWDHDIARPVLYFDIGQSVGDLCWSPISSTIFSVVSADGRVVFFDLTTSKPVAVVGDDSGQLLSFKLSPNLRKVRDPETQGERLSGIIAAVLGKGSEN